MNKIAIFIINFYRKHISPFKRPCCRFIPTCSQYAIQAFQCYSFPKAFLLSFWRICRCNPFNKGGYDPVPQKKIQQKGDN